MGLSSFFDASASPSSFNENNKQFIHQKIIKKDKESKKVGGILVANSFGIARRSGTHLDSILYTPSSSTKGRPLPFVDNTSAADTDRLS